MLNLGLLVAFGAMLSFSISDIMSKRVSAKLGTKRTSLIMNAAGLIIMLILAQFIGLTKINSTIVLLSILSGVAFAVSSLLLYKSLETEHVSNTFSLNGIQYALLAIFSVLLIGEAVSGVKVLSFIGIFVGAFLVASNKKFELNRGYLPAIFAFVTFAVSYMLLVFAQQSSGGLFLPLVISRVVAVLMLMVYLKESPEQGKRFKKVKLSNVARGALTENILMGVFSGLGSIGTLILARLGSLAAGSAIIATEPAVIVFLGYFLYKERFTKHQVLGFIILILGTITLSLV